MAFSKPDLAVLTPQRILLIIGLVALLLVPTGAFVVNQGAFDAFGPEDEIILQPADGPNGQYAEINADDELTINITDAGVNPNAVTEFDRVFVIGNTGGDTKEVWITHDNEQAITFYNDATGEPIGEANNVTLGANESVVVSLRVDTTGDVKVGTVLETTLIVHARIFNTPEAQLRSEPDFDAVTNGTTATATARIYNNGSAPLAVEDISINGQNASEYSIVSGGDVTTIRPDDASTVEIQFAPTSPGIKNATLDVATNDTENPTLSTDLSGESVVPGLEVVEGAEVNFGEVRTGVTEDKVLTIRNNGPTAVEITDQTLGGSRPGAYTVESEGLVSELAAGETRQVRVVFTPAETGWRNATLDIAAPGAENGGVTIDLTGKSVESALNVEPVPIAFDPIGKDKTAYKTVTISNRGSADLNLGRLALTGGDDDQFSLDPTETRGTIPPGENTTLNVSFTPTRAENLSTTLEIESNDGDEATKRIAVKGEGLAAKINTSPNSLNYGNVTPGTTKTLNITVENLKTSPTDLDVKSARILPTGQFPEAFSIVGGDPPYTLAPGESRDIEIAFSPDEDIEKRDPLRTAQLRILSDGEPAQIDVWLSNEGWRILVRSVPPQSDGVDGEKEKKARAQTGEIESLDPKQVAKDTKRVEMDVNDMPGSMRLDINVSTATTRQAAVGSDSVTFTTTKNGSFDTNFLHNGKPPTEDANEYTPPTDREITQYIQLTHTITDKEIDNASFKYRVQKAALPNDTAPGEVVFRRYEGDEWVKYDTTLLRESKTYYIYKVELPGLSEFVLTAPNETETTPTPSGGGGGGPPNTQTPPDPSTPSAPSTPTPIQTVSPGGALTATPGGAQPTPVTTPQTPPPTPQPTPTTPIIDASVDEVTVEDGNTTITFPDLAGTNTSSGQSFQDVISVEAIDVPPPGQQGRDGPRAEIRTRADLEGDEVEAAISGGSGVELQLAREDRAIRRIEAKGADTMTLVERPIPLTGSHSLFSSKESIEDNWRMVRQVNITVPPEFEDRSAIIRIRVPRERFGNTSPENATIARNNDGWQLLDTTVAERTDDAVILQAQTPGFSRFAVFADNGVSYSWEVETFDREFTGVTIDPSFDEPGIYNATLTVTDSFGLTDTARYRILVNDVPEVTIEALGPVAPNETVILEATARDEFGNVSYNWTLPNGTTVNGTNRVQYTFGEGTQRVRVTAIDEFGARGTDEATYDLGGPPSLQVNFLSRNFTVQWRVVLLGLLVLPLVFLLRMGLLRLDHPPVIEVFERPRIDLADDDVVIPRLRVTDSGGDLDRIAVRLLNYDGVELAREAGEIGGEAEYEGENVWIRAGANAPLIAGTRYVVEVWTADAADDEVLRARSIEARPGDVVAGPGSDDDPDGTDDDGVLEERVPGGDAPATDSAEGSDGADPEADDAGTADAEFRPADAWGRGDRNVTVDDGEFRSSAGDGDPGAATTASSGATDAGRTAPDEAGGPRSATQFVYPRGTGAGTPFVYPYVDGAPPNDLRAANRRFAALLGAIDDVEAPADSARLRRLLSAAGVGDPGDDEEHLAALSDLDVDLLDAVAENALAFFLPPDLDETTVEAILADPEQALAYVDGDAPGTLAGQADALARGLAGIDGVADPEGIADAVATDARKWEARL